jgi:hypothetical protein
MGREFDSGLDTERSTLERSIFAGRSAVERVGILGLAAGRSLERLFCCMVPRSAVSGGRGTVRAGPLEEPGLTLSAVVSD